jgi:hypothetical protein
MGAHDVEIISFVVQLLKRSGLNCKIPSHVLGNPRGNLDPFGVFPTLFLSCLKEATEAAANVEDVAGAMIEEKFYRFPPEFSFSIHAVLPCDKLLDVVRMVRKHVVGNHLLLDDSPKTRRHINHVATTTAYIPEPFFFEEQIWLIGFAEVARNVDPVFCK